MSRGVVFARDSPHLLSVFAKKPDIIRKSIILGVHKTLVWPNWPRNKGVRAKTRFRRANKNSRATQGGDNFKRSDFKVHFKRLELHVFPVRRALSRDECQHLTRSRTHDHARGHVIQSYTRSRTQLSQREREFEKKVKLLRFSKFRLRWIRETILNKVK